MKNKKTLYLITGIILGLAGGFLYWRFVGCNSGSCAITSKWYMSSLFGGVFGYLLADSIKIKQPANTETPDKNGGNNGRVE